MIRMHIETCEAGIIAATRALTTPELAAHASAYERRAADYRIVRAALLARLPAAPVYPGGRRAELAALMRAYKAQQVTPREFGTRLRFLTHA